MKQAAHGETPAQFPTNRLPLTLASAAAGRKCSGDGGSAGKLISDFRCNVHRSLTLLTIRTLAPTNALIATIPQGGKDTRDDRAVGRPWPGFDRPGIPQAAAQAGLPKWRVGNNGSSCPTKWGTPSGEINRSPAKAGAEWCSAAAIVSGALSHLPCHHSPPGEGGNKSVEAERRAA